MVKLNCNRWCKIMEELINRLLEYQAYKEITKTLKEKEQIP